jgi:transaldolase
VLRRIYDESGGTDGFASIEVEPDISADTDATLARARDLWSKLGRPNVMIKIPATAEGIPAIEAAIADGINVNVTLMFSVEVYRQVARAYIAGLRQRLERGEDVSGIASVASFFVSRVDTKVDKYLSETGERAALEARGRAAIANAKLAYEAFTEIFGGDEFADLRAAGAHVQRCLWASTSTKNPDYRDVIYVEELIGPQTVDTMPLETIEAFIDHGRVERTLDRDVDGARDALRQVEASGITMERVTRELLEEGVASFAKSFDELIETIESKRKELAPA